uniref:Uncharacterized protein n=1 Tax=Abalone asfa-like virus TaxID=2839893 RepID=A0A5K7XYQ6_9VIRU|nr:hypothetical protein [Abalone asfa-like virus]
MEQFKNIFMHIPLSARLTTENSHLTNLKILYQIIAEGYKMGDWLFAAFLLQPNLFPPTVVYVCLKQYLNRISFYEKIKLLYKTRSSLLFYCIFPIFFPHRWAEQVYYEKSCILHLFILKALKKSLKIKAPEICEVYEGYRDLFKNYIKQIPDKEVKKSFQDQWDFDYIPSVQTILQLMQKTYLELNLYNIWCVNLRDELIFDLPIKNLVITQPVVLQQSIIDHYMLWETVEDKSIKYLKAKLDDDN